MSYIGKTPTPAPLTSSDISDGIIATDKLANNAVVTSKITGGTISNADISSTVITGQTAITGVANDDLVLISDTSGSAALKKMTVANLVANAGGGKVLQVVNLYNGSGNITTTSTSFVDVSGMTLNITPASTGSKIYLQLLTNMYQNTNGAYFSLRYTRTIGSTTSNLVDGTYGLAAARANTDHTFWGGVSMQFLDSPNTTSQTTYKVQFRNDGGTATFGLNGMPSNMVAIEIGA